MVTRIRGHLVRPPNRRPAQAGLAESVFRHALLATTGAALLSLTLAGVLLVAASGGAGRDRASRHSSGGARTPYHYHQESLPAIVAGQAHHLASTVVTPRWMMVAGGNA